MSSLRQLAGQTMYYGMSSILGRFINFVLTPIYTYSTIVTQAKLGQLTELMSYTSIILILFTLRLEVAYFRYGKIKEQEKTTFDTALSSVWLLSIPLGLLIVVFAPILAGLIGYENHVIFIRMLGIIMAIDGCSEIPFSKLRFDNKAKKFASIKVASIIINVCMNVFFVIICPWLAAKNSMLVNWWFDSGKIIEYIFFCNVISSLSALLFLIPVIRTVHFRIDRKLANQMFRYALPLAIVGIFGNFNEMFGRIILKWFLPGNIHDNEVQLGIYGANYRLTMLITLFTQAFRYAAEPFFFRQSEEATSNKIYADVTKYYAIFSLFGFLFVTLFIDVLKYFIAPKYWDGLPVIPILLLANVFFGLYYNVSIWYRLRDRTVTGALIIMGGSVLIVLFNWLLIPKFGYIGSAWATLITYITITAVCYVLGKTIFPVPYQTRLILFLIGAAVLLNIVATQFRHQFNPHVFLSVFIGLILFAVFGFIIWIFEKNTILRMMRRRT
ncbi:MAG TPA: oligosaccharide flippase family protein [Saprospiraceae bacterium]|nr:oligosaccharide flippase family protein [Saprospiraceae bacterium]HQW56866.1 oligosaccharide flippase family protein [Saprospiraceae bacterium]